MTRDVAPKRSRVGVWLVASALLAGVAVTLYRNDVLFDLAGRHGVEAQYLSLERAVFGGPVSGTPRALESILVDSTGSAEGPTSRTELESASAPATR